MLNIVSAVVVGVGLLNSSGMSNPQARFPAGSELKTELPYEATKERNLPVEPDESFGFGQFVSADDRRSLVEIIFHKVVDNAAGLVGGAVGGVGGYMLGGPGGAAAGAAAGAATAQGLWEYLRQKSSPPSYVPPRK